MTYLKKYIFINKKKFKNYHNIKEKLELVTLMPQFY